MDVRYMINGSPIRNMDLKKSLKMIFYDSEFYQALIKKYNENGEYEINDHIKEEGINVVILGKIPYFVIFNIMTKFSESEIDKITSKFYSLMNINKSK